MLLSLSVSAAEFIGSETCRGCHSAEYSQWQGSHHHLAIAEVSDVTVLGNFNDAEFNYNGITSKFYRENKRYMVRTDGASGEMESFEITHTFGWEPLQQYLVSFEDGRKQALSIAWDSRSESEGGQRWFHLYPDEAVHSGDVLHWTKFSQNWNSNCAECHSTNLQKNYQVEDNSFATTWSEISVGCEACHGPGSGHISWVANQTTENTLKGFTVSLLDAGNWARALDQDTASQLGTTGHIPKEQQICAACHSRRVQWQAEISDDFDNAHQIQYIDQGLYHADGQILDEVYVYGSFLQSKMHAEGVTCSNCHNPHTAELKAEGNAVCLQCHSPNAFNTPDHHLHAMGSVGAECVACHMPETTYMVIDPRRDHSLRIPRPDLTTEIGSPNACTGCHLDQTAEWAATTLEQKFGRPGRHYGESLHSVWTQEQDSLNRLLRVVRDDSVPRIIQASALHQLPQYADERALRAAASALPNDYPDAQIAAIYALEALPPEQRFQALFPLLENSHLTVRLRATAALADIPVDQLPKHMQTQLSRAFTEYESVLGAQLDMPTTGALLAAYFTRQGLYDLAERAYQQASKIEPQFIPARLNLADLYRSYGDESSALAELLATDGAVPEMAEVKYALGLAYVRRRELDEAEKYLAESVRLAPETVFYRYAWVLALFDLGRQTDAIRHTEEGLALNEESEDLLFTLGYFEQQTGNDTRAIEMYQKLLAINPNHAGAAQQLRLLQSQ